MKERERETYYIKENDFANTLKNIGRVKGKKKYFLKIDFRYNIFLFTFLNTYKNTEGS